MNQRSASRLAWGIGVICLGCVIAGVVLLVLDWKAIDSPYTTQAPWIANAIIVGALGILITTRRGRHPIGWLLMAIAFGNATDVLADFIWIRGLLSGAPAASWVEWPAWFDSQGGGVGAFLLVFLIFFFPNGRLPSPRWRWVAWAAALAGFVEVTSRAGAGTRIRGSVPVPAAMVAA